MIWQIKIHGVLAQLVERQVRNLEARGSTPLCSTKKKDTQKRVLLFGSAFGRNYPLRSNIAKPIKHERSTGMRIVHVFLFYY